MAPVRERVFYEFSTKGGLARRVGPCPEPQASEVVVEVAGCGLCHTDIGFIEGSTRPGKDPVVLGHEISGRVVAAGRTAAALAIEGKEVLVPAILPCGECPLCRAGRGNVCAKGIFIGSQIDGGFATHVVVPAGALCAIDRRGSDLELWEVSVIADAVTTPLQAMRRARVAEGDRVVVVGAGGLGGFAVQIARAHGASVIALDIDADRLERAKTLGASATLNVRGLDERAAKDAVRQTAKSLGWGREEWKIFELSGTAAGQRTAFDLLSPRGVLAVVGFTRDVVSIRLSNVMALEAEVFGSWGAPPERYPEAFDLVRRGAVKLRSLVRAAPLSSLAQVVEQARQGKLRERAILCPAEGA